MIALGKGSLPIDPQQAGIWLLQSGIIRKSLPMRESYMKSIRFSVLFMLFFLPLCGAEAQEKADSETDIHNNVKLLEMPIPPNIPEDFKAKYQIFLGRLKQALKEKTSERSSTSALTIQVCPGIREVGATRTKQPAARITAFKKDSKSEYVANFLLHSYATGETINKEEIERFLTLQVLNPIDSN
jgi:hypothetical protein